MKYLLPIFIIFTLSGCSSIAGAIVNTAFEKATGTDLGIVEASCPDVRRKCHNGDYQEWYKSNGQKGCACNK